MLQKIRGKDITEKEMLHILKIKNASLFGIYEEDKLDPLTLSVDIEYYHCNYNGNMTIYLADDWYLIYYQDKIAIKFYDFFALPTINPMRLNDMLKIIKKFLNDCKGMVAVASMRHVTTYKFYCYLVEHGYITEISNEPMFDLEDSSLCEKLCNEYLCNGEIEEKYYDYLHHVIAFLIGDESDIKNKKIKRLQNKWLETEAFVDL